MTIKVWFVKVIWALCDRGLMPIIKTITCCLIHFFTRICLNNSGMLKLFRLTVINELAPNDTYMYAYLISYLLSDPLSLNAANLKL